MKTDNSSIVRAKDVMNKNVVSIDGMATAKEAAAIMRSEKIHSILVKKRNENDAWGILVCQDFITGVIIPERSSEEVNVYEIMTKPTIAVPAEMDIRYVVRLLHRAGIRRAPVEEKGEIIGMISLSSLILENNLF